MVASKRSASGDDPGSSELKKLRAESVLVNHERYTEATTEGANGMAPCNDTNGIALQQQSAGRVKEEGHESDAETTLARSAASKALYTTEILEQVLSYLTGPDIIAAVNVNNYFYNCAAHSPSIQEYMCLRGGIKMPPQCYQVNRTRIDDYGREVIIGTLGLTPTAGMLKDDIDQWAVPRDVLRLCPALQLKYQPPTNRAKTVVDPYRYTSFHEEDVLEFTAGPIDTGHLDMFASDPPATRAETFLYYNHVETFLAVSIRFCIIQDRQLTIADIFEEAKSADGQIWLIRKDASRHPQTPYEHVSNKLTLDAVMSSYIEEHGGYFILNLDRSWIELNALVPTEEERDTMRQVLAKEEEKKKKLMDPHEYAAWTKKILSRTGWQ